MDEVFEAYQYNADDGQDAREQDIGSEYEPDEDGAESIGESADQAGEDEDDSVEDSDYQADDNDDGSGDEDDTAAANNPNNDKEKQWCFCRSLDKENMIMCQHKECEYKWVHPACAGYASTEALDLSSWVCPMCTWGLLLKSDEE